MNDFTGFTPRAQKVISILSQQEARRLFSEHLLPEHIFLGLLRESEGAGVKALSSLGIDLEDLKREVETVIKNKSGNTLTLGGIPISERFKTVIDLSRDEARNIGHNYVGTEHLLLGVLAEEDPESIMPVLLGNRGVDIQIVRQVIVRTVGYGEVQNRSSKKKAVKTQFLDKYTRNICALAQANQLDPVVGREQEIRRLLQILSRRQKNNPILIGEPGVGKTAIVEGIAQLIVTGSVPERLLDKRILLLDMGHVVAGTKYRGEFEERMKNIIKEAEESDDVLLFIDEIHTILGAGNAEGALDASNMLKPALARGTIRCIGATTFDEYRRKIEKDKALVRRFQPITVNEPSIIEAITILTRLKTRYEEYHSVSYTERAIEAAVRLSHRYISERRLPDKAIDLIDEAGAYAGLSPMGKPEDMLKLEADIKALEDQKNSLVKTQVYEKAADIRDRIRELKAEYEKNRLEWLAGQKRERTVITEREIEAVLSSVTGIPMSRLEDGQDRKRYLSVADELRKKIKGQETAVTAISNAVKKNMAGLRRPNRPIASLIFLGPTGVGKTALAKALAAFLFGSEEDIIRVDMSEYMEKFNVSRMLGAPPGYIGHDSGGELTERVRRKPYSVVLFDEIEKAHPEVFNVLLQILDEGRLTDSLGNIVDFRNTVIILTSNIGTENLAKGASLGFGDQAGDLDRTRDSVMQELKKSFRPEFLNRIDDTVLFSELDESVLHEILDRLIADMNESLELSGIRLVLNNDVKDHIISRGFERRYGARSLIRALSAYIEIPVSEKLLRDAPLQEDTRALITVTARLENDLIVFDLGPAALPAPLGGGKSKKPRREKESTPV